MDTALAPTPVIVTDSAARRISEILADEAPGSVLRVSVEGGGCSGFQYRFDVTADEQPDDLVIEKGGVKVVVDKTSLDFLSGARIDFVDDLMGASFRVDNPQAASSCGCGTSFSI